MSPALDVLPLEEEQFHMLVASQTLVTLWQEMVYFQKIHDSETDMVAAILREGNALPRNNPRLLETSEGDGRAGHQAGALPLPRQVLLHGALDPRR